LEISKSLKRSLFIVCSDVKQEVLNNLVYNAKNQIIDICLITVPGMGDFPKEILEDLSIVTGSYLFDFHSKPLEECTLDDLGGSQKVVVTEASTFISGYQGDREKI
jgi:chaperonin GroEL (HSP60 family)